MELTHPGKILFPEANISKQQLANFLYQQQQWLLPHIEQRPLTILRCPNGVTKPCFIQKHHNESVPDSVDSVMIKEKETQAKAPYITAADEKSLLGLVQIGAIEFHTWGAQIDDVEHPDVIVFDIDPGKDTPFKQVIECAKHLKTVLDELQLTSFVKTTGKHGLHVQVPLVHRHQWDDVKHFANQVADLLSRQYPDLYTTTPQKKKRESKVFIDYLRNHRGATFIAPYSTRAIPQASIATPLSWEELTYLSAPNHYTIKNLPTRLKNLKQDPWHQYFTIKQSFTKKTQEKLKQLLASSKQTEA